MKKKQPADPQNCGACRFFLANAADQYGYCRRFPPVPAMQDGGQVTLIPVVTAANWCGEFARLTH